MEVLCTLARVGRGLASKVGKGGQKESKEEKNHRHFDKNTLVVYCPTIRGVYVWWSEFKVIFGSAKRVLLFIKRNLENLERISLHCIYV